MGILALRNASGWVKGINSENHRVISSHAWFIYFYGLPYATPATRLPQDLEDLPEGTIVVWDNHYSERGRLTMDFLLGNDDWQQINSFGNGFVVVFQKSESFASL